MSRIVRIKWPLSASTRFADFLTGTLGSDHSDGQFLNGETNRHFRSRSAGLFVQDNIKVRPNLMINVGLRWDWDGPLYEQNGLLTNFYPSDYKYDLRHRFLRNPCQWRTRHWLSRSRKQQIIRLQECQRLHADRPAMDVRPANRICLEPFISSRT